MNWQTTEPSLLARLRDPHDQDAWFRFENRYGELIVRYCLARGLQWDDAEDVRQMVLMNLHRAFPRFEYQPEKGRFRGYLATTVRRSIHRQMTRPFRKQELLEMKDGAHREPAAEDRSDEIWETEWLEHHLRLALRRIRPTLEPKSTVVFERFLRGEGTDEIASSMGMTVAAVHKVKQRVRDKVRALVTQQIEDEETFE